MPQEPDTELRSPSKAELALIVRMLRATKGWTQETLAELAGVASRTIQRLEDGSGAGVDTLRAIARAVGSDDLDMLIRTQAFPTEAGLKRQREVFERDYMTLNAQLASSGRAVEVFMGGLTMLSCNDDQIENPEALEEAAALFDYLRDYLDYKSDVSHQDRLRVIQEIDAMVTNLDAAGWTPVVATRRTSISNKSWKDQTPLPVTVGYLTLAPKGCEPLQLAVLKRLNLA